jgi:hypothetical protein
MTARVSILCACGLFVLSGRGLWAQSSPNASGPIVDRVDASNAPEPKRGPILNEPYSSTTEWENHKTLADGTHIEEKRDPEEKDFRDSQGRTRKERYSPILLAGDAPPKLQSILILDPIEGVEYYLSPQTHIACQGSPSGIGFRFQGVSGECVFNSTSSTLARPVTPRIATPSPPPSPSQRPRRTVVVDDLGTQLMEGLTVDGTRTTITIPAGAQGNDRPIETVSERWFSKELNIYVLIKGSDPRNGETTLRTTNIDRSEPDPSLFRVPPEYTIERQ